MRGASGEMRESRAKALRRKEGESSRYHPWPFAEEHKKTRCDARRTSTPGSCPSLCALAPWREISSSCSAAPREPIASSACAQKKPPERWSPRGAKDTNLFRERLDAAISLSRPSLGQRSRPLEPSTIAAPLEHRQRYPARAMPCRATGANSLGCEANRQHPCLRLAPRAARPCRPCWSGRSSPRLRRSACVSS